MALVREYATGNSQPAFETLVHRHVSLVYAVALRQTGLSGEYQFVNEPVSIVANLAEDSFGIPVIDQTGLKRNFDVDLKWDGQNDPRHENLKQAIADQLGLELVPGTAVVEMLVVEKAK